MTSSLRDRTPVSRASALWRVAALYLTVQLVSYLFLQASCSSYVLGELWIYGALGPLAAFEAVPRFRYHSPLGNIGFVVFSVAVLVAPFAYVIRPRAITLILSAVGLVVWCLFGLGFTIDHM